MVRPRAAAARREIIRVCRRLDAKGHLAGAEGNVSVRAGAHQVIVTPAGRCKADLRVDDLIATDLTGRTATRRSTPRSTPQSKRRSTPSSEFAMHLAIYAARPDVCAVVHAHPVAATGFAVARKTIPAGALAEVAGVVGPVPLVPYRAPGGRKLAVEVATALRGANVALLASHGAVAVGPTIAVALQRMESLEQAARIVMAARILGGERTVTTAELRALERAWQMVFVGA